MLGWINSTDVQGVARHYSFTNVGELMPADATVWAYKVADGSFGSPVPVGQGG